MLGLSVSPVRISRESLLTGVLVLTDISFPAYNNSCPMSRSYPLRVYQHPANLSETFAEPAI